MTQLLNLPVMNAPASNNADKPVTSATNSKDNETFASEFDRRVNDSQSREKDKTKTDSTQEVKTEDKDKTTKAEKADTKDGKKLPPEKSDTDAEATDGAAIIKNVEDANPQIVLSLVDSSDSGGDKKIPDVVTSGNKAGVAVLSMDIGKSGQTAQGQTNASELSTVSIRADILQALQKQGKEGEAVATEKFKSMMQNASKMPQQNNVVSAEVIASIRQLEPQTERSSATTLSTPLVFSTTTTAAATPAVGVANVSSPAVALDIQPQLNNAAWARVMSSRIVWMAREGVHQAELRLNPAHLGPVEVRLSMQNDQTSVTFIASNAAARDALEQALPRLRESFNENGLALNHAEVSHQEQSSQGSQQDDQLGDGSNTSQVIVEVDDNEDESTHLSDVSTDNSVGVSVFA